MAYSPQPERSVYLDHAATTYLDPRVKAAMEPFWENNFGNPSALYTIGRQAREALDASRKTIAHVLHCQPAEIIFTSGGTESDNLAILGIAKAYEHASASTSSVTKKHIITSQIEHKAVLGAFKYLATVGYDVTFIDVDSTGLVNPEDVRKALRPDTLLVSIMYANNEIGTIQPIREIAKICRENGTLFHTDACQAAGALPLDVEELSVDLLTLNAGKIYGPKGIGLLYVRQGVKIQPLLYGGGQEKELRSGTENLPAIVGFAKALELINYEKDAENKRLTQLRDWFFHSLSERLDGVVLNGHPTKRLPNNLNVIFKNVNSEDFLLLIDNYGIACASGSACDSNASDPSHVLRAIGLSDADAQSSLRFTLGKRTSKTDLEYAVKAIVDVVKRLRSQSKN